MSIRLLKPRVSRRCLLDNIQVGPRRRKTDDSRVREISESMRKFGLLTPVAIRIGQHVLPDGEVWANVPVLITGAHRLAAAALLERETPSLSRPIPSQFPILIKAWSLASAEDQEKFREHIQIPA